MPQSTPFGNLLDGPEFVRRSEWNGIQLADALRRSEIFAIELNGKNSYPEFPLNANCHIRELREILLMLAELPSGSKLQFFTTAKGSLGGITPFEGLKKRRYKAATKAARGFVDR